MQPSDRTIIAIDGYSSCGKSTFARLIARDLNFVYIDSGAMYRAVALYCIENGILAGNRVDLPRLQQALPEINIRFSINMENGMQETWLNNVNIEEKIRGIEVSSVVSSISQIGDVRTKMVAMQRKIGEHGKVVMDGRDIGTVVFPNAILKIFMTADPDVRAKRRYDELTQKGITVQLSEIAENIRMRDREDENRPVSPLRRANDALVLDNSYMTIKEQMKWFRKIWDALHEKNAG